MLNFSIFNSLTEANPSDTSSMKRIVIAPGRYNPPHNGHRLVVERLTELGLKLQADPVVIIVDSGKQDESHPLDGRTRMIYMEKMFPHLLTMVAHDPFEAVVALKDQGYVPVGGVSGSDRADTYKGLVGRVFKDPNMEYITEILARDPDSEQTAGVSSTKARQAVCENDFPKFRSMVDLTRDDALSLFEGLRVVLGDK